MSKSITLDAPLIGDLEEKFVLEALRKGFVSTYGPYVREFEGRLAKFLGVKDAVALQSGTAALHMALHGLRLKPRDEVIVPALTFIASVNPVIYAGAKPVFADVDPGTWTMQATDIARKITARTRAIICVHLYGNPCDMKEILRVARQHKLHVIEDATESLGSLYAGRHTGTLGDFGCFSFNGNKMITTGGGGLLVCKKGSSAGYVRLMSNQARPEADYIHTDVGFNYRMTNLEASLGLAQLSRLKGFVIKKKKFTEIYRRELSGLPLQWQEAYSQSESCLWMNAVLFENARWRKEVEAALQKAGIPFRRIFAPIPESTPYRHADKRRLANSYGIYDRGLCLPSSPANMEKHIVRVCKAIRKVFA